MSDRDRAGGGDNNANDSSDINSNQEVSEEAGDDTVASIVVNIKDPAKMNMFYCDHVNCSKFYSSKSNLKKHVKEVHLCYKPYKCGDCGIEASQKISLQRHISSVHLGNRLLCGVCGKEFTWETDLRRHYIAKHSKTRFKCKDCGKDFSEARSLSKHKKVHHGGGGGDPMLLTCDAKEDCHFQSYKQSVINIHKKHYHEELLKACSNCDYKTLRVADLRRHVRSLHQEVQETYKCSNADCGAKFKRKDHLKSHEASKHAVCGSCGYISTSKRDSKRHIQDHEGANNDVVGPMYVVKVKVEDDNCVWIVDQEM